MKIKFISFFLLLAVFGCEKIGKKVENYDLFGLEQAGEAIEKQEEKIKAAREYQKKNSSTAQESYRDSSILK